MTIDTHRPTVELVALLASAGGLDALSIVLRDLPTEFPAAILVQQHLGGHASVLPTILRRQTARQVSWAQDGQAVEPGQVIVCPPGMYLELTSDGCCRLRAMQAPGERRFDVLLASVASAYGARSVGVMLSGSGRDGAAGTVAMKRAGAIVIAQSPDTAQYGSMPIAAARAGADLVLPIYEIGHVLADIVAGAPLPEPRPRETGGAAIPLGPLAQSAEITVGKATAAGGESMDTGDVIAATRDSFNPLSPSRAMNSPATRAEVARLRAAELRRRREDLAAGFGATAQSVAAARRRAEESLLRAHLAHQAAEEAATRWAH
jgi:two-component system, chemotaxis family, protein-glutamate methylesterase/glutaminase